MDDGDELYVFGYGYNQQFPNPNSTPLPVRAADGQQAADTGYLDVRILSTPTCALRAESIVVVWASWCDLILKVNDIYHYTGTSLFAAQIASITTLPTSPSPTQPPIFFGRPDTSGVLGFILPSQSTLTTFTPPHELTQEDAPQTRTTCFVSSPWAVLGIYFTASDAALVHLARRDTPQTTVIQLPSLQHVHDFLSTPQAEAEVKSITRTTDIPAQVVANTASLTTISASGTLHTLATDPRFARAAGRDPDSSTATTQPVPFLEHTPVTSVAAGGLYTAALAEDGELFIWGQAMAGTPGELRCLANQSDDEDEYVRTVDLGEGARVVDMSVGAGHVLVAVERGQDREVWAAGDNRYGALGLRVEMEGGEFVDEVVEVQGLRGRRVKQLVCAGMSSYVVVEADRGNGSKK